MLKPEPHRVLSVVLNTKNEKVHAVTKTMEQSTAGIYTCYFARVAQLLITDKIVNNVPATMRQNGINQRRVTLGSLFFKQNVDDIYRLKNLYR